MSEAKSNHKPVRVLLIEDSPEDADLLSIELRRGGYVPVVRRVDNMESLEDALSSDEWDVVISDYSMPDLQMRDALERVRNRSVDVPFLIVSATIGEEAAVEAMRAGAHDYILKDKLGRLVPAIERELREAELRRERRNLEEQLRQAQKLESLGLLAGGVAHDFNNLLTGILGNASLALEILTPPEPAHTMLEDVIRASERAADLTRQLLAYAGKGQFVIQQVDLSETVREIADLIRTSIPRNVELRMELDPDLPPVEADASQIQQLVMNLVLNAGEAIGNRHGTVLLTTANTRLDDGASRAYGDTLRPGLYVVLDVEDNGCGMDEQTMSHIFDPFYTTKFTGRGLGLAAVQGIVRAHKGAIRVISAPGAGSTFRILLPAGAAAHFRAEPEAKSLSAASLAGSGAVLVVDDESIVRRTARAALERYGYRVTEAAHGREAVDLFHTRRDDYDIVVLDLMMPVMGGEETFEALKKIRPDVPVILSSGYDEQEAILKFRDKPFDAFIQKPYTSSRLAEKIKTVLRNAAPAAGAGN